MFPDNELSSSAIVRGFTDPTREPKDFLIDFERGGVALNDSTGGLSSKIWTIRGLRNPDTGEIDVVVDADGVPTTVLFSGLDITEVSLAFDQNMNPFVAYVQSGQAKFWWYDSTIPGMTVTNLPVGSTSPRCCLDERRPQNITNSDIVLSYIRSGSLYFRLQRERYLTEHLLMSGLGPEAQLVDLGMNTSLRLQWRLRGSTENPQAAVNVNPYLADVVQNLVRRAGVKPASIDVSELYDDVVVGYRVANTEGVDSAIKPLAQAFAFDPAEFDRKIHFRKRGRSPVVRVKWTDLVARNVPMKRTRLQEDQLPKRVNVNHLDPEGGFAKNKQFAHRRSNMVRTKREDKYDFDFAIPADDAATIAMRELKRPYYEQMKYEFGLPIKFSFLTVTDVIEFEDEDGTVEIIRLEDIEREDGELSIEGTREGGTPVYGVTAAGLALPAPRPTTPGLVGETRIEILNVPVLFDEDDELGVYIALAGASTAWYGAQVMVSTDGGANYTEALRTEVPSILGDTETALEADDGYTYPSRQTVDVRTNFELASTTKEGIIGGANRAIIGDEVIQFETATHLGDNLWRLSGLVRGRYNTEAAAWPIGTRFVLFDEGVLFLRAERWMLGTDLSLKPVSFGATLDETIETMYLFDEAVNQTEWPVHHVTAVRDGSNNVTVEFIGRARLGVDSNMYDSKYFRGYRIKFDDGFSVDTYDQSYTRASTPAGVTITVCALNEITGEGPFSEGVLV